jgi:GNAT superfamily N-acetyltransferase
MKRTSEMREIEVRQATPEDTAVVSSILLEASNWLESRGMGMWRADELHSDNVSRGVSEGLFFVAHESGQPVGTIKFELSDMLFWPDASQLDAAYVHRLAVRRACAGGGVSGALLSWAVHRGQSLGRRFLRLDCEASRPRLRALYEDFGFEYHSERQVGPYTVARYQLDINSALGRAKHAVRQARVD